MVAKPQNPIGGFGGEVDNKKILPEKGANKAVLRAEGAILEMKGESILGSMDRQKMVVFEKPDR